MAEIKFEEALSKLEGIVEGLEQGKISLEDSLKKYEEGIKLARFCSKKLDEAEQKIEVLTKDSSGKPKREAFKQKKDSGTTPKEDKKTKEDFLF